MLYCLSGYCQYDYTVNYWIQHKKQPDVTGNLVCISTSTTKTFSKYFPLA